jgi:hypothetical protein
MHLNESRACRAVFKVQFDRFQDIGAKFLPCLAFGKDGVTECTGAEAAFLPVANLENQLHKIRIPKLVTERIFISVSLRTQFHDMSAIRRSKKCHNSEVSAPYMDKMEDFVEVHPDQLLGRLTTGLAVEGFDTNPATTFSWKSEIIQLQKALRELLELLPAASQWSVLLEYVLPGIGQRVDCVLLASDVIYVIEYKGGDTATALVALKQAQEYALNLVDFHEEYSGPRNSDQAIS